VGYKEYVASVEWDSVGDSYTIGTVFKNDFSATTTIVEYDGVYAPGFQLVNSAWNALNMLLSVLSYGTEIGDTASSVLFYETTNNVAAFGTSGGSTSGANQIVSVRVFE
jgi:hypothetical protein